jgi:hypothetical protein
VHAEFPGCPALIPFILLQYGQDKPLLEFAYCLGIEDVALVHLHDEGFELISHGISLSECNAAAAKGRRYENVVLFIKAFLFPGCALRLA